MKIGYARVSTEDQTVQAQVDALEAAGCDRIFTEVASGAKKDRPILNDAIQFLRDGDVLVCYKLDRVARSLPHLIAIMDSLNERNIGFQSLTEDINTTTPSGKLIFHIFGAISEFERDLIKERTMSGLAAARRRGRIGGRPKAMTDQKKIAAIKLLSSGTPAKDVAETIGVSLPTLYRHCPAAAHTYVR